MTITEIQSKIQSTLAEQKTDEDAINSLRESRAKLVVENSDKNSEDIASLDSQIAALRNKIDGTPAVIEELNRQLSVEQQRVAEAERAKMLKKQKEICKEIETLSQSFVKTLQRANEINKNLRSALTDEVAIRNKTNANVLTNWCHGSMQSLDMLLQTMKAQLEGRHTAPVGPGIFRSAMPLML